MPERRLLVDNDAFIVLAGCGLLGPAAEAFGFKVEELVRLGSLPHMLQKSKSILRNYPTDVRQRAEDACRIVQPNFVVPEASTVGDFTRVPDISAGEVILFSLLVEQETWLLCTGDKRAITAFGGAESLRGYADRLRGRIISLERVLWALVRKSGAEEIANALGPLTQTHQTLKVVFSAVNRADDRLCLEAINSYLDHLSRLPGVAGLLYDRR